MTPADISLSPHYGAAEKRRQRILDFLLAHPGARLIDIGAHMATFGDTHNQITNVMVTMVEWGEIRHAGNQRTRQYFAAVDVTRSDDDRIAARNARLAQANEIRRQQKLARAGAHRARIVHRPGDRPIRNQGGQGAYRAPVCASGAQNY